MNWYNTVWYDILWYVSMEMHQGIEGIVTCCSESSTFSRIWDICRWGSRPDPWECEALRDVARVAGQMGQLIQPKQRFSWSNHQVLKSCNSQMFCDFRTGSVVHCGWWHSDFRYIQLSVMLKPIIGFAPKHEPASIGFGGSLMVLVGETHVQSFQL